MADEVREVVLYEYTGDVSDLRKATSDAIGLLDQYTRAITEAANSSKLLGDNKSMQSYKSSVTGLIKSMHSLKTATDSASHVDFGTWTATMGALSNMVGTLFDQMGTLASGTQLGSGGINQLSLGANTLAESIGSVADEIKRSSGEFGALSTIMNQQTSWFRNLGGVYDATAVKLRSFSDTSKSSLATMSPILLTIIDAFRRFGIAAGDASGDVRRLAGAHTNFSSTVLGVGTVLKGETDALNQEKKALKSKKPHVDNATKSHKNFGNAIKNLLNNIIAEINHVNNLSKSFGGLNTVAKTLRHALAGLTGVSLGQWLAEAAKESISYKENLNLFTVATGDAFEESYAFVKQMQEIYGMDPSNLMRYAGNFYQLADAIEMPDAAAAKMSLSLVKATNDIASLFNVDVETVFNDLSSGMQGMSRAVRKYGMDIRTTTLQQTALTLGITQSVESMSETNRQGLRFITMMRQATNASGDFAKTIEQPANQLRIFKEQMTQLGRAIGNFFIKPLTVAIQYLNGFIMALRVALTFIGSIFGFLKDEEETVSTGGIDKVTDAVGGIGDAAGTASKELKKMLAPFDELIVMQSNKDSGSALGGLGDMGELDPAIAKAIEEMELKLEEIEMKANQVRDAILEFFGFEVEDGEILSWSSEKFEQNLINKFPQWTKTIQAAFDHWSDIVQAFQNLFSAMGEVVRAVWEKIIGFLSKFINDDTVSSFISNLADNVNKLASFISEHSDTIADFIITITGLVTAFKGFSKISPILTPVIKHLGTFVSSISGIGSLVGWVAGIAAAIGLLYTNSSSFATSFNSLIGGIVEGLGEMWTSFVTACGEIGASIGRTWSEHIQPFLTKAGDALAPVLGTILSLWNNVVSVVSTTLTWLGGVWTESIEPMLGAFFDALGTLATLFETLWGILGPIFEAIGLAIEDTWNNHLLPCLSPLIDIIASIIEIMLALWNEVLAPLLEWFMTIFGPNISNGFQILIRDIKFFADAVLSVVEFILDILSGLMDFIVGVFTGDWQRAWDGVARIFKTIWEAIKAVFMAIINWIVDHVNSCISTIVSKVSSAVSQIKSFFSGALDFVKNAWNNFKISFSNFQIPRFADGGPVGSGQLFMARENGIPELVGSFGHTTGVMNNDQIVESVSAGVARAVAAVMSSGGGNSGGGTTIVEVDGEKLFKIIVGQNRRAMIRTGVNLLGGAT